MLYKLLIPSLFLWLSVESIARSDFAAGYGWYLQSCKEQMPHKIDGYFWRDLNDSIPYDAYPGKSAKGYQTTYIGKVFDPANKGVYIVTIFSNQTTVDLSVFIPSKLINNVQILCTQEPEKLVWIRGVPEDIDNVKGEFLHEGNRGDDGGPRRLYYVGRTNVSRITRFGGVTNLTLGLRFTIGKQNLSTQNFDVLVYYRDPTQIPPTSLLPVLNKTGPACISLYLVQMESNIGYYWRTVNSSRRVPNDALVGGRDQNKIPLYIAQRYLANQTWYPPSYVQKQRRVFVTVGEGDLLSTKFTRRFLFKILCTLGKQNFKWVGTNAIDVKNVVPSFVVGGGDADGTLLYVGRGRDYNGLWPGRVYIACNPHITYVNDSGGVTRTKFEVLTYTKPFEPKS